MPRQLDPGQEGAGERLGVGERHHLAGALDQRMLRVRHVPPEGVAGERVKCEQVVEENVS